MDTRKKTVLDPQHGIGDKIKYLIEQEGISVRQLELKIGAGKGVLYTAINKGTDINAKWLCRIIQNYPSYVSYIFDIPDELPAPAKGKQTAEDKLWTQVEFLSEQLKEKDTQIAKLLALLANTEKII